MSVPFGANFPLTFHTKLLIVSLSEQPSLRSKFPKTFSMHHWQEVATGIYIVSSVKKCDLMRKFDRTAIIFGGKCVE